jgi:hypothetical protein
MKGFVCYFRSSDLFYLWQCEKSLVKIEGFQGVAYNHIIMRYGLGCCMENELTEGVR